MDLHSIEEYLRPTTMAEVGDWQSDRAWLAGGTWFFTEAQLDLKKLVNITGLGWTSVEVTEAGLTAPSYNQKMGHPLLFCRSILPDLWHIEEASQGLRAIVTRFYPSIRFVEWDSAEVLQDLNSPAAYWQSKGESPPGIK